MSNAIQTIQKSLKKIIFKAVQKEDSSIEITEQIENESEVKVVFIIPVESINSFIKESKEYIYKVDFIPYMYALKPLNDSITRVEEILILYLNCVIIGIKLRNELFRDFQKMKL